MLLHIFIYKYSFFRKNLSYYARMKNILRSIRVCYDIPVICDLIGQSLHILYILYIFVSLSYLINLWQRLQLYFVCPSCIPFPHVPFHGLNLIELKGISTQNLLTKALWLQDFFFQKHDIFNQEFFPKLINTK